MMKKVLSVLLCISILAGFTTLYSKDGYNGKIGWIDAEAVEASSYKVGDIIEYGTYPQSRVTDSKTLAALNSKVSGWVSYRYFERNYSSMAPSDYMRYCDITFDNHNYRGVVFDTYRPNVTRQESTTSKDNTYQDDNGYTYNTIYWFKYEPLRWKILDSSQGLVMCETIIDSQPFNNYITIDGNKEDSGGGGCANWGDSAQTFYANDYANSSIHKWLNEDFYLTAFSESQQKIIKTTTLNNDGYYTLDGTTGHEDFDSKSTNDKIFLLSIKEVENASYGFDDTLSRRAIGSDYAKCQGLYVCNADYCKGCSHWYLRTPGCSSENACYVFNDGRTFVTYYTASTYYGVRPAMCLKELKSDSNGSEVEEPQSGDYGISLEKEKYKTTLGDSFDIKVTNLYLPAHEAGELIWESSDRSVSIVPHDKYATVTAEKPGYAVITVSSHGGGYSDQCIVFVGDRSLVIGKEKGFLEVNKEFEFMVSLCDADYVNMSDNKTVSIDQAYASAEEISEITFVIADQSIATITSTKIEKGVIKIKVKGVSEGITYVTVTYNTTGETRYFPIYVTNAENTYYINNITEKTYYYNSIAGQSSIKDKKYNFSKSGINIFNFEATDSGEGYSNIKFDVYNTTGIIGSVDVYNEKGDHVKNIMIDSFDFQPTDPIKGAKKLYYLVPSICTLSYNDITNPINSSHTSISFKLPTNGYFKIQSDISASTSCLIYNAVNLTIESISKFSGLKSTLSSKQKDDATKEITEKIVDYIFKVTGLDSESGALLKTMSKLKDEMLKDAESFNAKNVFSIMDELCKHLSMNIDYVELAKSTITSILKSAANEVLLSLDRTKLAKLMYKYQKWENYFTSLSDLNKYNGDGSVFVYNIQGGTKRISNGIIFEGSTDDVTIFRAYEISYGDLIDELNEKYKKPKLYDISMVKNNTLTQPKAKVKVLIPIPLGYDKNGLKVYRINDDGTKTDMNAKPEGNYMVFETDHFSYYSLVEEIVDYTITYDANGGTGAPAKQTSTDNHFTLSSDIPKRVGYNFLGWGESSTAKEPKFKSGDKVILKVNNATLYAIWEKNPLANAKLKAGQRSTTVDYRTDVTIIARAENVPDGYVIAVVDMDAGKAIAWGDNKTAVYNVGEVKEPRRFAFWICKKGGDVNEVGRDANGEPIIRRVDIDVKSGFFDRLFAFFLWLFKALPTKDIKPE